MCVRVTLLICIHKHSFGGFWADTLTFCASTPFVSIYWIFWEGVVWVGGRWWLSASSKAELRFPILFVEPPVAVVNYTQINNSNYVVAYGILYKWFDCLQKLIKVPYMRNLSGTLFVQKIRVYTPLFHGNYFHKESSKQSTLFEKSAETFSFLWIWYRTISKERVDSASNPHRSTR